MNIPKKRPVSDEVALNEIAALLGTAARWDSPADFLEEIATIIASTSRPHPGDAGHDSYTPERRIAQTEAGR
jgi:hypothetical protein